MEFAPIIAMGLLVVSIINFMKYLRAGNTDGWFTQLVVWVSGVVVVVLAAQTDFAGGISIGDMTLSTLNFWSLVFVGLTLASVGSFAVDLRKAIDNGDSAVKPSLLPPEKN